MKIDIEKSRRILALQTALCLRTCPPDQVLFSTANDPDRDRHVRACPACRERLDMAREIGPWKRLHSELRKQIPDRPTAPPRPGQVWFLSRDHGGWSRSGRYFNPPAVLLLKRLGEGHAFLAAQLYHDRLLAGEGDVWLSDRYGFAEAWNHYSLHADDMETLAGEVEPAQLDLVLSTSGRPLAGAKGDAILDHFRELEIDVASRFAIPSTFRVVEELEAAVALSADTPAARLSRLLTKLGQGLVALLPDWTFPTNVSDPLTLLLGASPPPSLAAGWGEEEGGEKIQAIYVVPKGTGLTARPVATTVARRDIVEGQLFIEGAFAQRLPEDCALVVDLVRREDRPDPQRLARARETHLLPGGARFLARFENAKELPEDSRIQVLVIGNA